MKGANKSPLSVVVVAVALCFLLAAFTSDAVLLEKKAAQTMMMEEEELLVSSKLKYPTGTSCYDNCRGARGRFVCCGTFCGCQPTDEVGITCPPSNEVPLECPPTRCYPNCRDSGANAECCGGSCGCSLSDNQEIKCPSSTVHDYQRCLDTGRSNLFCACRSACTVVEKDEEEEKGTRAEPLTTSI